MDQPNQPRATGPLLTVLEEAGVQSLAQLAAKPTHDLIADLDRLPIPPSEALLGALVLHAVSELQEATGHLDAGTSSLLKLTRRLVVLAALTLAAAVVTLIIAVIK